MDGAQGSRRPVVLGSAWHRLWLARPRVSRLRCRNSMQTTDGPWICTLATGAGGPHITRQNASPHPGAANADCIIPGFTNRFGTKAVLSTFKSTRLNYWKPSSHTFSRGQKGFSAGNQAWTPTFPASLSISVSFQGARGLGEGLPGVAFPHGGTVSGSGAAGGNLH